MLMCVVSIDTFMEIPVNGIDYDRLESEVNMQSMAIIPSSLVAYFNGLERQDRSNHMHRMFSCTPPRRR